jgi:hypothetical protein
VILAMTTDASELLVPHARLFTVGFIRRDPPAPSVLGSGVLLTVGQVNGILTCAHVAEAYRNRSEIGLLRFSRDNIRQMQMLQLGDTHTVYVEENIGDLPWSNPHAFDLAFTQLPVDVVTTLNATSVFLNWDLNVRKLTAGEPQYDRHVDAVFGLVDEFSGEPQRGSGLVTTPMQGVLTPGHVVAWENDVMTLECMDYNVPQLPESFGGTSGGGLWRIYLADEPDGSYRALETRLVGIASFQRDATHIMCQAFQRIEQCLVPAIRQNLGG